MSKGLSCTYTVLEEQFMSHVLPKGQKLRKAIRWISDERINDGSREIGKLIEEVCSRLNLSPLEEEFLHGFYAEADAYEPES
jgi:hypothetical protein